MARFVIVLFLCSVISTGVFAKKHSRHHHKKSRGHKIVGGYDADIKDFPHQAFLLLEKEPGDTFGCGGSILNTRYILTAAHCLPDVQTIHVRIGGTNKFFDGTQYPTESFFSHPNYDPKFKDYDIALVKTSEEMVLDGVNATTVKLADEGTTVPAGTMITISGWGDTSEGGEAPQTLMAVEVPVVGHDDCNKSLGHISERQICAGYDEGGKDACQGDSGGPAILSSDKTQIGVVSSGYGCARPHTPGIYTSVAALRSWIKDNTGA